MLFRSIRGWTLLHEAAGIGNSEILDLVLQYGANPHAVSLKIADAVPCGLENKAVTPGDVAKHEGEDTYLAYVKGLKLAGLDVALVQESEEDTPSSTEDIFWPAESEGICAT